MPSRGRLHPLALRLPPPYARPDRAPCAEPGCITLPNGYNPGPYCLIHTSESADAYNTAESTALEREAKAALREKNRLALRAG